MTPTVYLYDLILVSFSPWGWHERYSWVGWSNSKCYLFYFCIVATLGRLIFSYHNIPQQQYWQSHWTNPQFGSKSYRGSLFTAGCSLTLNCRYIRCIPSLLLRPLCAAIRTKRCDPGLCRPPDRDTKRTQVSRAGSWKKITVCVPRV